ncbi:MAG: class I adenylate-forming enzyme family protein [Bryobacteraceae bacterium]
MNPFAAWTLKRYETEFRARHRLFDVVDYWAARKPEAVAWINATRGTRWTWAAFDRKISEWAGALWRLGFAKGDFLATSLPLSDEHILLEYACFRLGVIHVPLDLRLSPSEALRCLALVDAKGYGHMAGPLDPLGAAVREKLPSVSRVWAIGPGWSLDGEVIDADPSIVPEDGAQVIFTTGSTGAPKAALLTHRGITAQNMALGAAFRFSEDQRVLINLPPSHVGCQAELLMSTFFWGATAVTLEIFDAAKSLEAIEQHKVTLVGQIPAMFQMEWRAGDYSTRDLSSLRIAVYGGQAVPRPFLEKMRTMAPLIGTGLGLTEASGFCTYTDPTGDVASVAASLGYAMPVYGMTIREPMHGDGMAGAELPGGAIGHVCFHGPQTFAGYVNDPEATARAISRDGYLYTGDLGFVDDVGLHFSGRAKWVIKPAGNQVYPGDVESHLSGLVDKVASAGVVGHEHRIWSEGIIAFVEKRPGADLTEAELKRHSRALTSYMRPLHYVIVEPGQMPLNRVAKVDTLKLQEMAKEEVRKLRERGRWDGDGFKGEE